VLERHTIEDLVKSRQDVRALLGIDALAAARAPAA
jgi:hypothetical protein